MMTLCIPKRNRLGLSLVELLCVIGIITVLAGLLLGPVARAMHRAQAMKWAESAQVQLQAIVHQLRAHFRGRQDFPSVTLEQLEAGHLLDSSMLSFLKDRRVSFIPFSGSDPDDQVVILVKIESGFLTKFFTDTGFLTETKGSLTKPPE